MQSVNLFSAADWPGSLNKIISNLGNEQKLSESRFIILKVWSLNQLENWLDENDIMKSWIQIRVIFLLIKVKMKAWIEILKAYKRVKICGCRVIINIKKMKLDCVALAPRWMLMLLSVEAISEENSPIISRTQP